MRIFAAVRLPDEASGALAGFVEPRRDSEWRWTRADTWHITLVFLAHVDAWRLDELNAKLADAASRTRPFEVSVQGVGCFPDVARAKVVYAAIADPTDSLPGLSARTKTAATTSGIEVARERYLPHVTLARRKRSLDASRWVRALSGLWTPTWTVAEIVLFESHIGEGHGRATRHEAVERFPLGSSGRATAPR